MNQRPFILLVWLAFLCSCTTVFAGTPNSVVILSTARYEHKDVDLGSMWRYFETWQSDVTRIDGKLVNVDIFGCRRKASEGASNDKPIKKGRATPSDSNTQWIINEPKQVIGSPFPPDNWQKAEFDDSVWIRHGGPFPAPYRSVALICMRGKFQVTDPASAGDLTVTVKFQGGLVAYVNGHEVGRAFLPEGKIANTTLAEDYPHETYVDAKGDPLMQPLSGEEDRRVIPASETSAIKYSPGGSPLWKSVLNDEDGVTRFRKRGRSAEFKIPASLLKEGVNVLAVEIHRAVADPVMFLAQDMTITHFESLSHSWNRASCEEIVLSAGSSDGVIPNISRPKGMQVWNEETVATLEYMRYGDPSEPLKPIQIRGMRNGTYSGSVVVGSLTPLNNPNATATDLIHGNDTIPASAIQVMYSDIAVDSLIPTPPSRKDIPTRVLIASRYNAPPRSSAVPRELADKIGVMLPVWVVVKIPRDAAPGTYTGTLTVNVAGDKSVAVPIEVKVVGNWVLPDPKDFITFMGAQESADSVALQYNVPLWSEEHWKQLDRAYELLGEIGTKDLFLPLIAKTQLANEQSMVRWIKQPDGTYSNDFSILERYLDTAVKRLGTNLTVCLYLHDYGFRMNQQNQAGSHSVMGGFDVLKSCVTELDPSTGKLTNLQPPAWGTPEARAFWKPVVDKTRELVANREIKKPVLFALGANNQALGNCIQDLKTMYPDILWATRSHFYGSWVGDGNVKQDLGYSAVVGGVVGICYEPDLAESYCGWKPPELIITFPRAAAGSSGGVFSWKYPAAFRIVAEGTLFSHDMGGYSRGGSRHGIGQIGADFWPVLKDARGGLSSMVDRYVTWDTLSLKCTIAAILAPGPEGPEPTVRFQLMREALQEAEARIFVQEALMDKTKLAKLSPKLAARSRDVCMAHLTVLRYFSQFSQVQVNCEYSRIFSQQQWEDLSEEMYEVAGEISSALGQN